MSPEYKLGYSRGYNAGRGPNWPAHRPPQPPLQVFASVLGAAIALRDGVDCELAMLCEEDKWSGRLGPLIDTLDQALVGFGDWIKSGKMKHERTIARLAKAGMSAKTIADVLEIPHQYVAEILRRKPEKRNEREAAIAELKAEGYTAEEIAAVFGE